MLRAGSIPNSDHPPPLCLSVSLSVVAAVAVAVAVAAAAGLLLRTSRGPPYSSSLGYFSSSRRLYSRSRADNGN